MRVLVFQHVGVEHPGIFRDFMTADGHRWDAVEFDRGDAVPQSLAAYDALMVMGGPMDVWEVDRHPWLAAEKAAIRDWVVRQGKPYLGICLGHQLLADAIGGTVAPMAAPEVGICEVQLAEAGRGAELFRQVGERFAVFQWHSSAVTDLPAAAAVVATDAGGAIQGFRYGARAFGLQFHVEITADTVGEWAGLDAYRQSLEAALGPHGVSRLDREVTAALAGFNNLARRLYVNFCGVVEASAAVAQAVQPAVTANPPLPVVNS